VEKKINFYVNSFDTTKEKLDTISPSFCAAKWLQVSLHLTNGRTHSCYHPPTHQINIDDIHTNPSALHNTKQKFEERKMMLSGKRPDGCDYCWKIEDAGHISDRFYRSSEHWASDRLDEISKLSFDCYDLTKFAIAISEDCECRKLTDWDENDPVQCYRQYIQHDKKHLHQWKRNRPDWI
jgi:hypothetical protein